MKSYCLVCRKNTDNANSKMIKTKSGRNKKSRFVKEKEAKGILSPLGMKTPLSRIPGLNILF